MIKTCVTCEHASQFWENTCWCTSNKRALNEYGEYGHLIENKNEGCDFWEKKITTKEKK
jgi:hypothetical protein